MCNADSRPDLGHSMMVRRHEWATLIILWLIAFPMQAEETSAELYPAIGTVAMLSGALRDVDTFGAGIVFAQRDKVIYIATANHVVRSGANELADISVRLKPYPDIVLPARLLPEHSLDLDLALLEVTLPDTGHEPIQFDFHVLVEPQSKLTDSLLYPVGRANNRLWSRPISPVQGFRRDGNLLLFESSSIARGASGGGLVEESGVLLGMVLSDTSSFGQALDIHVLTSAIKSFGYPVDLSATYAYDVAGEWEGNDLFQNIVIERDGDRITGHIHCRGVDCNYAIAEPYTRHTTAGFVTETVLFGGLRAAVEGELRGNRLLLRVSGAWTKSELTTGGAKLTHPQYREINFVARLDGRVEPDQIRFDYEFEYGAVGERSRGSILAKQKLKYEPKRKGKRKREPEVKTWQSILQETIKAKKD